MDDVKAVVEVLKKKIDLMISESCQRWQL